MKNDEANSVLKRIIKAGQQRKINRRHFMQHTTATGLALGAASTLWTTKVSAMTPQRGGTFRVGNHDANTSDTHDPALYLTNFMIQMAHATRSYLTLINPDNSLGPDMAVSWSATPDAKTWTFDLNKEAVFHDGRSFTARDAVASINHHRGEDTNSAAQSLLEAIADVRADGEHTLVVEMSQGTADLPWILTDYHVPMLPVDADGKLDWQNGIGAGPYRLVEFQAGVGARLERHEGWHSEGAWFDAIEMTALNDPNARQTALVSGDVDAIASVDLKTLPLLQRQANVKVINLPSGAAATMAMNCTLDPFKDANVRLALKYGIDREDIIAKILSGAGTVGNDHHISPSMPYYPDLEQRAYDPDKSAYHLKQTGLDRLDVQLSATDSILPGAVDAATLYSEHAKKGGISIKPVREPSDGFWSEVWMNKPFVLSYWGARPTPDTIFTLGYGTISSWNEAYWSNERFDELLKTSRAELDDALRGEMYAEMAQISRDDGGTVLPMFTNFVYATRNNVGLPEQLATSWQMDGARAYHRWWFAA